MGTSAPSDQNKAAEIVPSLLLDEIRNSRVVLVLGAGATIGCTDSSGVPPPKGAELARLISTRFLGGQHQDAPLSVVSELAASESSLSNLQEYVRETFDPFQPAPFHKLIARFVWRGIATTNFDLTLERAYESVPDRAQDLVPFIKNGDRVEQLARSARAVRYLKLHGCISRTSDVDAPLILTIDQYNDHLAGRDRLFGQLKDWAYENTLVFAGHSLRDPDVRRILSDVGDQQRPRFYSISPDFTDPERRLLEFKRITPIESSFAEFLEEVDRRIPVSLRGIAVVAPISALPAAARFTVRNPGLNEATELFLSVDTDFVRDGLPSEDLVAKEFYKGHAPGWTAIQRNLDVRRRLTDTILSAEVSDLSEDGNTRFVLISGHAGSGKTVLLKRVAWDAATTLDRFCLYAKPNARIEYDTLREVVQVANERLYLFVDHANNNLRELINLAQRTRKHPLPITVFMTERTNEWNTGGSLLSPFIDSIHEVRYLSEGEILDLLGKLNKHRALGELERLNEEERYEAFEGRAGRQLLVALHETTAGKPFEDIIADEYTSIRPDLARSMYLGICTLNQFDVPVRAGLVSRVYGVPFSDFKARLFKPLELVVFAREDPRSRDMVYEARHPHIAEMLVDRILVTPQDRANAYLDLIPSLNIDYDSDRRALRQLVRARTLIAQVTDHDLVRRIYQAAESIARDDYGLVHQQALYEMNRVNGSLRVAESLLSRARALAPWNETIIHSFAELELRRANLASDSEDRERHLRTAEQVAARTIGKDATNSVGYHTKMKVNLERLRSVVSSQEAGSEVLLREILTSCERTLTEGLQQFPGDSYLLDSQSRLHAMLEDEPGARAALERAYDQNPSNSYIVLRLARQLHDSGDPQAATRILKQALDSGSNEKQIHYLYGVFLEDLGVSEDTVLEFHLRRGFTEGDRNYQAQYRYARRLYINGNVELSHRYFESLRSVPLSPWLKRTPRDPILEAGAPVRFSGMITRLESAHGFVSRDGPGDSVFFHIDNVGEELWSRLRRYARIKFDIEFTWAGPRAIRISLERDLT